MTEADFETGISSVEPGKIEIRGLPIEELVASASFSDVACLVIKGETPSRSERIMLDAIFASAADHGFVGTPTAVTRYAASGSGSVPAAVAAGILGIGLSTAVPHLVAELLLSLTVGEAPKAVQDAQIDACIQSYRDRHERIPGLGHPIHRSGDPRTDALRQRAAEQGCYDGYPALVDRLTTRFSVVAGRPLSLNVDGMLAAILLEFGWTPEQIFGLTILALTPSLVAHALEETACGKPMRIIRPDCVHYLDQKAK